MEFKFSVTHFLLQKGNIYKGGFSGSVSHKVVSWMDHIQLHI